MKVSAGKNAPQGEINVFVEIPKDSNIKYELDKESGIVFVDRFLHTAMRYPFNYGFIPNTLSEDGDPIDVLVLSEYSVAVGTVIPSVVIGMLDMEDEAGGDVKILAVPHSKIDPLYGELTMETLPKAIKNKIKHFFENYKTLEPEKWVKIKEWKGKEVALKTVQKSLTSR
ncbi:MAG: inorganic pyrophosphatase [Candidatus Levybacteria bacterium RIFCSPHIGHO2_02_FULL_42_12]|nr:MAG: inorganic pyrophosphatase [Candidatus Levybacteria bacterium RIFCSPHIGHO2_01_FULL_42_15]OGH33304.1 MAG: inorganic pyrophosphatase [Candidatus Levybacteria bacterium RIFCSPHIGHO2_02_FULL_42_12]